MNIVLVIIAILSIEVPVMALLSFFLGRWFVAVAAATLLLAALAFAYLENVATGNDSLGFLVALVFVFPPILIGGGLGGWIGLWLRCEYKNAL